MKILTTTFILFTLSICNAQIASWKNSFTGFVGSESSTEGNAFDASYDNNTYVLGAYLADSITQDVGKVIVYERVNNIWSKKGQSIIGDPNLSITGKIKKEQLGSSVSISGNGQLIAAGTHNAKYVIIYEWDGNSSWIQKGSSIYHTDKDFGNALSFNYDGSILCIGSPETDEFYTYKWENSDWVLKNITSGNNTFQMGSAVDLDSLGTTIAVGSRLYDHTTDGTGALRVFSWNPSSNLWDQKGNTIKGNTRFGGLGSCVDLSHQGTHFIVGAPNFDSSGPGKASVYVWNGNDWMLKGGIFSGPKSYGYSVSISEDANIIAIGENYTNNGLVHTFYWDINKWVELGPTLSGENNLDKFGWFVHLSSTGKELTVTAPLFDTLKFNEGKTYLYDLTCAPIQTEYIKLNNTSYTWNFNNTEYINAGSYTHTINPSFGCIVTKNLELSKCEIPSWLTSISDSVTQGRNILTSVAISKDGNTIGYEYLVNGNEYYVSLFENNNGTWVSKGDPIYMVTTWGDATRESFDISDDGNTFISSILLGNEITKVFNWDGSSWNQKGNDITDFHQSLSIDGSGNIIAASNNTDEVKILEWNGVTWSQKGQIITTEKSIQRFGGAISINKNGNTVIIGAINETGIGETYVYQWKNDTWVLKGEIIIGYGPYFGSCVDISNDGNTIVSTDVAINNKGSVYIYEWNGYAWTLKGLELKGNALDDQFGYSAKLSGDGQSVVIGAPHSNDFDGQTNVYSWIVDAWVQQGTNLIHANKQSGINVGINHNGSKIITGSTEGPIEVYELSCTETITDISQGKNNSHGLVFPNPFTNYFKVLEPNVSQVIIYDTFGNIITNTTTYNGAFLGDDLPHGIYILKVVTPSKNYAIKVQKL